MAVAENRERLKELEERVAELERRLDEPWYVRLLGSGDR